MGWKAGVIIPTGASDLFLLYSVQTGSGPTQPHAQWIPRALSPVLKRSGSGADHSPPSNAEIKNGEAISPLPHIYKCFIKEAQGQNYITYRKVHAT
jgi:hypothetical protein